MAIFWLLPMVMLMPHGAAAGTTFCIVEPLVSARFAGAPAGPFAEGKACVLEAWLDMHDGRGRSIPLGSAQLIF